MVNKLSKIKLYLNILLDQLLWEFLGFKQNKKKIIILVDK